MNNKEKREAIEKAVRTLRTSCFYGKEIDLAIEILQKELDSLPPERTQLPWSYTQKIIKAKTPNGNVTIFRAPHRNGGNPESRKAYLSNAAFAVKSANAYPELIAFVEKVKVADPKIANQWVNVGWIKSEAEALLKKLGE